MDINDAKRAMELQRGIQRARSDLDAALSEDACVSTTILKDGKDGMCRRAVDISPATSNVVLQDVVDASNATIARLQTELDNL